MCVCVYMYTYTCICMYVCMYVYIYIYIYICMYVCMYVCIISIEAERLVIHELYLESLNLKNKHKRTGKIAMPCLAKVVYLDASDVIKRGVVMV